MTTFASVHRFADRLYRKSPAEHIGRLRRSLSRRSEVDRNSVLEELLQLEVLPKLLAWKLRRLTTCRLLLLGDETTVRQWRLHELLGEFQVQARGWEWQDGALPGDLESDTTVILCRAPTRGEHWRIINAIQRGAAVPVMTIGELLLDFSPICELHRRLPYFQKDVSELFAYYLGEKYFGPLDSLDDHFRLADKRIIEFGPFDGCQTLGLMHLGARSVTCVEARAENAIKTSAAAAATGFTNVDVAMDDLHNATPGKYGRFDLAFAHGVYYHSIAPFVFLNNLVELADTVFVGGFCATDELPSRPWETLEDAERTFRVKRYVEGHDFSSGVNQYGYFFHKEDLQAFFRRRGLQVTVISDESSSVTAGNFSRFLATR